MPHDMDYSALLEQMLQLAENDTEGRRVLGLEHIVALAAEHRSSQGDIERRALGNGIIPKRYIRNFSAMDAAGQTRLLDATVLLVGLGGLGGTVLEILARMGVGTIIGADGDVFEESNLNRQALCAEAVLGQPKSAVAAKRVRELNAAVRFIPIDNFLHKAEMRHYCAQADLVVDALGGLEFRADLHSAAQEAGLPLISAAVAGWAGFVGSQQPDEEGLQHFFQVAGTGAGAEEVLGCPAPGVRFAATLEASEAIRILAARGSGREQPGRLLLFDLADFYFENVRF